MLKAFKYRLYPTAPQAEKINQNISCARFVYNLMLDAKVNYPPPKGGGLSERFLVKEANLRSTLFFVLG